MEMENVMNLLLLLPTAVFLSTWLIYLMKNPVTASQSFVRFEEVDGLSERSYVRRNVSFALFLACVGLFMLTLTVLPVVGLLPIGVGLTIVAVTDHRGPRMCGRAFKRLRRS
jgi:hypothetical protein